MFEKVPQENLVFAKIEDSLDLVRGYLISLQFTKFDSDLNEIERQITLIARLDHGFAQSFEVLEPLMDAAAQLSSTLNLDKFEKVLHDYKNLVTMTCVLVVIGSSYHKYIVQKQSLGSFTPEQFLSSITNLIFFFEQQKYLIGSRKGEQEAEKIIPAIQRDILQIQEGLKPLVDLDMKSDRMTADDREKLLNAGDCLIAVDSIFAKVDLSNLDLNAHRQICVKVAALVTSLIIYFQGGFYPASLSMKPIHKEVLPEPAPLALAINQNFRPNFAGIELARDIFTRLFDEIKGRQDFSELVVIINGAEVKLTLIIEEIENSLREVYECFYAASDDFSKLPDACSKHATTLQEQYRVKSLQDVLLPFHRQMKRLSFDLKIRSIYNQICCDKADQKGDQGDVTMIELDALIGNFREMEVSDEDINALIDRLKIISVEPSKQDLRNQLLKLNNLLKNHQASPAVSIVRQCIFHLGQLFEKSSTIFDLPPKLLVSLEDTLKTVETNLKAMLSGQTPPRMSYSSRAIQDATTVIPARSQNTLNQEGASKDQTGFLTVFNQFYDALLSPLALRYPTEHAKLLEAIEEIKEKFTSIASICRTYPQFFPDFESNFSTDINKLREIQTVYLQFNDRKRLEQLNRIIALYRNNIRKLNILTQLTVFYNEAIFSVSSSKSGEDELHAYLNQLKEVLYLYFEGRCLQKLETIALAVTSEKTVIVSHCLKDIVKLFLDNPKALNLSQAELNQIADLMSEILTHFIDYLKPQDPFSPKAIILSLSTSMIASSSGSSRANEESYRKRGRDENEKNKTPPSMISVIQDYFSFVDRIHKENREDLQEYFYKIPEIKETLSLMLECYHRSPADFPDLAEESLRILNLVEILYNGGAIEPFQKKDIDIIHQGIKKRLINMEICSLFNDLCCSDLSLDNNDYTQSELEESISILVGLLEERERYTDAVNLQGGSQKLLALNTMLGDNVSPAAKVAKKFIISFSKYLRQLQKTTADFIPEISKNLNTNILTRVREIIINLHEMLTNNPALPLGGSRKFKIPPRIQYIFYPQTRDSTTSSPEKTVKRFKMTYLLRSDTEGGQLLFFKQSLVDKIHKLFLGWEESVMDPSEKAQEVDLMTSLAMSLNMTCKDVPAEGNCFFEAIVDQLKSEGLIQPDKDLRKLAMEYIVSHKEQYEEILKENYDSYVTKMQKSRTWADSLVIQALIKALSEVFQKKFKVVIFSSEGKPSILGYEDAECTLCLGYAMDRHYYSFCSADGHQNNAQLMNLLREDPMTIVYTENSEAVKPLQ